jgi:hypothetical protein
MRLVGRRSDNVWKSTLKSCLESQRSAPLFDLGDRAHGARTTILIPNKFQDFSKTASLPLICYSGILHALIASNQRWWQWTSFVSV